MNDDLSTSHSWSASPQDDLKHLTICTIISGSCADSGSGFAMLAEFHNHAKSPLLMNIDPQICNGLSCLVCLVAHQRLLVANIAVVYF